MLLVTGLGCGGEQPADSLHWQERWEMLATLDDGGVLDLDMRVDNLGLLRGQGHVQLALLDRNEGVTRFSRHYAPVQVEVSPDRDALRLGGQGPTIASISYNLSWDRFNLRFGLPITSQGIEYLIANEVEKAAVAWLFAAPQALQIYWLLGPPER